MERITRHHEQQRLVARNVVAELQPLWEILDFHRLQESTGPWLKAVRPVIERGYLTSQWLAAEFYKDYRQDMVDHAAKLEVSVPNPLGALGIAVIPDRATSVRIMAAMKITGPVWMAKQSQAGMDEAAIPDLISRGFSKSTGAATRLVLNGGRGMVRTIVDADQEAVGIIGIADDGACKSCQFLASTPLLKEFHTSRQMDAVAVGHDFCTCSAAPVFN